MDPEIISNLEAIEKEKSIDRTFMVETLRTGLISAIRKMYPDYDDYDIEIDPITVQIKIMKNGAEIHDANFSRIAAQTAKQVILQKLREAEREAIFQEYRAKMGEIITGEVHRVEGKNVIVYLGEVEAILPKREQIRKEEYRQGQTIKAYLVEVRKTSRGPDVVLSRTHPNFVRRLFELEVPEISEGVVEIKGVAREAGARTKIAVYSQDEKIDCVGSCVGMRGQRVKNIVLELNGEKIDIVRWNPDTEIFIRNALAPAELAKVNLSEDKKTAEVLVKDDQLSLAIGKKGQNVRLSSKLTGWELDIRSLTQRVLLEHLEGVGAKTAKVLKDNGIETVKDLLKYTVEDLTKFEGIGAKTAQKVLDSAHQVFLQAESKEKEFAKPQAEGAEAAASGKTRKQEIMAEFESAFRQSSEEMKKEAEDKAEEEQQEVSEEPAEEEPKEEKEEKPEEEPKEEPQAEEKEEEKTEEEPKEDEGSQDKGDESQEDKK